MPSRSVEAPATSTLLRLRRFLSSSATARPSVVRQMQTRYIHMNITTTLTVLENATSPRRKRFH
jgi:hypothetical protein